ncbi:Uma2 family endonuclease [Bacillus sp. DJP31]|uniref:Uma2 family endonuclease n=1 Tax=Bacillus sp. DJP31 TaxID=3409789 RepID=UPI003BB73F0E
MKKSKDPAITKQVNEQSQPYSDINTDPSRALIDEQYEIINGIRYDLLPSPTVKHQLLVTEILNALHITCHSNGILLVAPIDVYLDEKNTFQPDVIFIMNENISIIQDDKISGAPDLVVEILSPSTGKRDKTTKKETYARFGVKEYWIVDPIHQTLDQFLLNNQSLNLYATLIPGDSLRSPLFSCINIDIDTLFQDLL